MEKKDFNFSEFVARVDESITLDSSFRALGERLKFVQNLDTHFISTVDDDLQSYILELDSFIEKHLKSLDNEKRS